MRVVAQRVSRASVEVDGETVGQVGAGLVLFVGVGREDVASSTGIRAGAHAAGVARAIALADKVADLRIFRDSEGKSNLSLLETGGSALVISQFTLYADYRRGRRPSFTDAGEPVAAEALVEEFRLALERRGVPTAAGRFGAHMIVSLVNDGPYTIVLDSDVLAGPRGGKKEPGALEGASQGG
jgi:D-aminoacyl-tRNA deacylase